MYSMSYTEIPDIGDRKPTIDDFILALKWMIDNDDTNRGDEWDEINAYWIRNIDIAIRMISNYEGVK